jgi:hypothetical protein
MADGGEVGHCMEHRSGRESGWTREAALARLGALDLGCLGLGLGRTVNALGRAQLLLPAALKVAGLA